MMGLESGWQPGGCTKVTLSGPTVIPQDNFKSVGYSSMPWCLVCLGIALERLESLGFCKTVIYADDLNFA